jgi:hypothetical protein
LSGVGRSVLKIRRLLTIVAAAERIGLFSLPGARFFGIQRVRRIRIETAGGLPAAADRL